ncbi:MAG: 3,4-dihydroxy-2-butanone-4-phosphate synthase, partial [Candidatus Heimdallarchaeota archaeon]
QQVGKLIDEFHSHELKQTEFIDQFRKSFKVPGHVPVIRSSLHQLKSKVSPSELSLALCEVAKYPMSSMICDMIDSKTGTYVTLEKAKALSNKHNIPMIDTKTVIDLWRSILKVPKNQIAEYKLNTKLN